MNKRWWKKGSARLLLAALVLAPAGGCASAFPLSGAGEELRGVASWYGSDFHGRPTASGEIYDMHAMTAAHKTLPLGTVLDVRNLDNGRSVRVVVNDRGPFVKGRILDLSYEAARRMDMIGPGTARVALRVVGRDPRYRKYIKVADSGSSGPYVVQLGAFTDAANARRLRRALAVKYRGAYVSAARISGRKFYRVRIGSFEKRAEAMELARRLADEGYAAVLMRK